MDDTKLSENRYRKYLEDDNDTYLKPEDSTTTKIIMGGVAAAGLLGSGYLAFKGGALRDMIHEVILSAGRYRRGKLIAANNAVRAFSGDEGLDSIASAGKKLAKGNIHGATSDSVDFVKTASNLRRYVQNGMTEHEARMKEIGSSQLRDTDFHLRQLFQESKDMQERLYKDTRNEKHVERLGKLQDEHIMSANAYDKKAEKVREKQTGFSHARVQDLIDANELSGDEDWIREGMELFNRNKKDPNAFLQKIVDDNILIDKDGNLADLRDFRDTFSGFINSLSTDFTIPFVKINPLRMFYMDQFFSTTKKVSFHVATSDTKNPIVTGHNGAQGKPIAYIDGNLFDLDHTFKDGTTGIKKLKGNYFLADAQKGPVARLVRNMSGITISEFSTPAANAPFTTRAKYHLGSFFDIGFQDEPAAQADFFDPTSWISAGMNVFTKRLRQEEYVQREDYLTDAFGQDKDFIYMRSYKTLEDSNSYKDYLSQFTAGRDNMEDVTMATLFPYGFFERLNATLNQVNLGLSNKALGSAFDVFGGLVLKRIAPIWAGMELWDYVNYESENFLGFQIEDRLAQMYANSSVQMAQLRDNLGITDWAKGVSPLIVGGEHIAEIPMLGNLLDWNDSAEEEQEFWEEGEVAVRKGRWWPLGNTPFTGGKIDYYQPNWVRRTLADAEFSDVQYGSREEYFENSWMPTLRHPLAPIRHFFTDPYHWEEKHYQDRPYMVTGGISELENFPLIGPILSGTIGQILKPEKIMHADAWTGQGEPVLQAMSPETQQRMMQAFEEERQLTEELIAYEGGEDESEGSAPVSVPVSAPAGTSGTSPEIEQAAQQAMFAYSTAGGAVQLLEGDPGATVYDALAVMDTRAPMATGQFSRARLLSETDAVETQPTETSFDLHQLTGNLHYNMTEMGGFYGFASTTITGEVGDQNPVLQSSSEIGSYTRAFWDMDMGGFGGDANEIFRRFLPADRKLNEVNVIENTMPGWLPGSDYFVDFQTGDPYTKVKKGELRLPGEGYERLYGLDKEELLQMDIGASFIGYDEETIRTHMLKGDAYKEESFFKILNEGTKWHKEWETEMNARGIAQSTEQYVKDEATGIGGFYDVQADHQKLMDWMLENAVDFKFYQAVETPEQAGDMQKEGLEITDKFGGYYAEAVNPLTWDDASREDFFSWMVDQSPTALIDPKTRGAKAFANDEMHFENVQQVNFYATQQQTPINYLIHVNRENPEDGIKVFAFEQNQALYEHSVNKVEGVRQGIRDDIDSGKLHRGDLYEIVDRYRMLGDVAPYSQEFRDMKSQMTNFGLSEEELEEVRQVNDQVVAKKKKLRLYDYRYSTANIENDIVTVDHIIDNNTFMAVEFPDNPIRLAGIRVSNAKDNPLAEEAERIIRQTLKEGGTVKIAYDADEQNRVKNDTYKTIQAVLYDRKGRNVNKYLLDEGLAKEKETDFSPAAVHARFTPGEINFGSWWEKFAHMDTVLHTKLLQVRSPLESYERREVYGKDWQEWNDPVEDFLVPAIQNAAIHHPLIAIGGGAFIGAAFGSMKSSDIDGEKVRGRYGKIVGGLLGASIMAGAVLNRIVHEAATGEAWIPERRQKERDTEEYFDVLEYIKYNKLYDEYAKKALKTEGFDVKEYLVKQESKGEGRKAATNTLAEYKQELYRARSNKIGDILVRLRNDHGIIAETRDEAMKAINKQMQANQNDRAIQEVTPLASKALLYHQAAEQTMYGYDPGDPIVNMLAALPKKDRDYLTPFMKAPEEERDRILAIVPNYMKRVLQSAWGLPVDEKLSLGQFFEGRPLPGANWKGWREDVSLDTIKVKFVDQVGLDPSEFDIWPDDQKLADQTDVSAPDVFGGKETAETYSRKIQEILTGMNVQGLKLDIIETNEAGIHVDMNLQQDRKDDVQRLINREGNNIM